MKKVLIVDDTAVERKVLSALLERLGCQVACAEDAGSARQAFVRERPDLVLTDRHMPGEDGLALVRDLRSLAGPRPVVFVLMSADAPDARETDSSVDGVLQKPISVSDLKPYLVELPK